MNSSKSISILGCGWLGLELAQHLIHSGNQVRGSTTTPSKINTLDSKGIESYLLDLSNEIEQYHFFDSEILIINIPPGRKDPAVAINYPIRIQRALKAAKEGNIKRVLLVSSTGVFASGLASSPEWEFPIITDQYPNATNNSSAALIRAEELLQENFTSNGTILRFGGLVGGSRLAGRFLAGKKDVLNGKAPVNMIHQEDCIAIIHAIIEQSAWGRIYNACTDEHPSREAFYTKQADKYGFEVPTFLQEEKAIGKIIANGLLKSELGYDFIHPSPMQF